MSSRRPPVDRYSRPRPDAARYRERREIIEEPQPGPLGQRLTAALLALTVFAFLTAYGLAAVTSRATAIRILGRAVPPLTEVNLLLALHEGELQAQAQAAPGKPLTLAGFPIQASLNAGQVQGQPPTAIEASLVQNAAAALYDHGYGAFVSAGGGAHRTTGALFSAPWTLDKALSLLNARQHQRLLRLSEGLGLFGLLLIAAFCLQVGSYGRIVGVGVAILFGALLAVAAAFLIWLMVQLYSSSASTPLAIAGWGMFADIFWTLVLFDAVGALVGAGLLIAGFIFAALGRERPPRPARLPAHFAPQIERRREQGYGNRE